MSDVELTVDRLTKQNSALRSRISDLQQQLSSTQSDESLVRGKLQQLNSTRSLIVEQLNLLSRDYEEKIRTLEARVEKLSRLNETLTKANNLYREEQQLYESRFIQKERLLTMLFNQEQSLPYRVALDESREKDKRDSPKKDESSGKEDMEEFRKQSEEVVVVEKVAEKVVEKVRVNTSEYRDSSAQSKKGSERNDKSKEIEIDKQQSKKSNEKAQRSFVLEKSREQLNQQVPHSHQNLPAVQAIIPPPPPPRPPAKHAVKAPAPPPKPKYIAPVQQQIQPEPQGQNILQPEVEPETLNERVHEPAQHPRQQIHQPVPKQQVAAPPPPPAPKSPPRPHHQPATQPPPPPVEPVQQHVPPPPPKPKRRQMGQFKVLKFQDDEQPSTAHHKPRAAPAAPSPPASPPAQTPYQEYPYQATYPSHEDQFPPTEQPQHQHPPTAENFFAGLAQSQISEIPHSQDITATHYFTPGAQIAQPHFAQDSFATEDDHSRSMSESVNFFDTLAKTPKPAEYPAPKEKTRRNKLKVMDPSKFD